MSLTHEPTISPAPSVSPVPPDIPATPEYVAAIERYIARRSFAVLSTVSNGGFPHAAGVAYSAVGDELFVNTIGSSRKARNVASTGRAAVVIPVRRVPVGPPFTIQFQALADVVALDDPQIVALVAAGKLDTITGHGELDEPDGCFLRIRPTGRIHTYGLGVSALAVARDPLHVGARSYVRS